MVDQNDANVRAASSLASPEERGEADGHLPVHSIHALMAYMERRGALAEILNSESLTMASDILPGYNAKLLDPRANESGLG